MGLLPVHRSASVSSLTVLFTGGGETWSVDNLPGLGHPAKAQQLFTMKNTKSMKAILTYL